MKLWTKVARSTPLILIGVAIGAITSLTGTMYFAEAAIERVPDACLAASIIVGTEEAKMSLMDPSEMAVLNLEFCRVIPSTQQDKALLLVVSTRQTPDGQVEDAFAGKMAKDPKAGWVLIGTTPLYTDLVLKPVEPPAVQNAGQNPK